MAAADTVVVGDVLSTGPVLTIKREMRVGAFTPYTLAGDLVVDGVVASSYTRKLHPEISPGTTHALLAVRRALYVFAPKTMIAWAASCTAKCDVTSSVFKTVWNGWGKLIGMVSTIGMASGMIRRYPASGVLR